jgi:hypothetical protein
VTEAKSAWKGVLRTWLARDFTRNSLPESQNSAAKTGPRALASDHYRGTHVNLEVGSSSHAVQTVEILKRAWNHSSASASRTWCSV